MIRPRPGASVSFARDPARFAAFCELLRDEPAELWVTLRGGSMAPGIPPGSRVRLCCDRRPPQPGEVAAYRRGGELVVHRVLERVPTCSGTQVRFQGDANPLPDPDVPEEHVVGRVIEIRRPSAPARLYSAVLLPLRRILWRAHSIVSRRVGASAPEGH